ncbi:MAG: flagellar basal body-associated FliL family protein [Proteobacteria bacterium]|nr:flagellar basal body-associated FliL family protein [Pseudomonadota bacterium]MBU1708874.1 flagellar basal body-associated FliL family protein [Pseudomonadota bacterium]
MVDEPENAAAENEAGAKKTSKVKLLIIAGLGALVLGVGGFFGYKQFLAPPPPVATEDDMVVEKTAKNAVIGEIVTLQPFTVNLADPRGKRYLKVKIEIELENPEAAERTTKADPKLRDTVIMMLTSLSFEEVMTPEGKTRIRDELLERFSQTLKPDRVKNIYFTEFVVQ